MPHSTVAITKPVTATIRTRRRPNLLTRKPDGGVIMAAATMRLREHALAGHVAGALAAQPCWGICAGRRESSDSIDLACVWRQPHLPCRLPSLIPSGGTMRLPMRLKTMLLAIAVVAVSFFVSLKAMDWLSTRGAVRAPVLVELPPL